MDSPFEILVYVFTVLVVYGLTVVVSLLIVGVMLVRLPVTYFLERSERALWVDHHPIARLGLHLLKNLLGIAVVILGLLLSLPGIPGQGVLTVLIGLMLIDFPGKMRLERRLIQIPRVRHSVDRLRQRYGKPPLILDGAVSPPREMSPIDLDAQGRFFYLPVGDPGLIRTTTE